MVVLQTCAELAPLLCRAFVQLAPHLLLRLAVSPWLVLSGQRVVGAGVQRGVVVVVLVQLQLFLDLDVNAVVLVVQVAVETLSVQADGTRLAVVVPATMAMVRRVVPAVSQDDLVLIVMCVCCEALLLKAAEGVVGFAQWSESRPAGECPRELPAPVQMDVQVVVQAESQPAGLCPRELPVGTESRPAGPGPRELPAPILAESQPADRRPRELPASDPHSSKVSVDA